MYKRWYVKYVCQLCHPIVWYILKSNVTGAQCSIYCAVEKSEKLVSGGYYADFKNARTSKVAQNEEHAEKLWRLSQGLVQNYLKNKDITKE